MDARRADAGFDAYSPEVVEAFASLFGFLQHYLKQKSVMSGTAKPCVNNVKLIFSESLLFSIKSFLDKFGMLGDGIKLFRKMKRLDLLREDLAAFDEAYCVAEKRLLDEVDLPFSVSYKFKSKKCFQRFINKLKNKTYKTGGNSGGEAAIPF